MVCAIKAMVRNYYYFLDDNNTRVLFEKAVGAVPLDESKY